MAYHSGISPPTDPSSEDRSRTGDESRRAPGRVPTLMSIVRSTSEQPQQQGRRSNQSSTPEDVQVVIASRNAALARRGRSSQQGQSGDRFQHPSSSATRDSNMGPELNRQQAVFLAGASASQAYHASSVAEQAVNMAAHFQQETRQAQMHTQEIRNQAQQREIQLAQVAAGLRNEAEGYVNLREQQLLRERAELQSRLEQALQQNRIRAEQELASRTEMLEAQAQREIVDRTQRVEHEARQWANSTNAQHQTDLEEIRNQARAAIAEVQRNRDEEIQRLEGVLARQIASQQRNVDGTQVPIPKTGSGLSTPQTRQANPFGTPNSLVEPGHPLSIPMSFGPGPIELPPGLHVPSTPPNMPSAHTSVTSQQLAFSQPATPKAFQPSQDVTGQQAAGSSESQVFSKELGDLVGTIPKDEKGFAFLASVIKALGGTIDDVGSKADAQGRNSLLKSFDERMKGEIDRLAQAYPPASSSQACVPIAAPCAPPQLQGAAVSAPPPVSILPAGMPPLPIPGNSSPVRGRPTSQASNQGTRGRSGSSESSSPSRSPLPPFDPYHNSGNAAASSGLPPSGATCRICGGQHDEINCPYLTMNQPQAPTAPSVASTRNYADERRIPLG